MIYKSPFPDVEIPVTPLHEHVFERADQWSGGVALIDGPTERAFSIARAFPPPGGVDN